ICQHSDLDGTGLWHHLIAVYEELFAGGYVFHRQAEHAVQVTIDVVDLILQLLPEGLPFLCRRSLRTALSKCGKRAEHQHGSNEGSLNHEVECTEARQPAKSAFDVETWHATSLVLR